MKKIQQLTSREIDVINQLMEKDLLIILEPRKNGYYIYEYKKKMILRPEEQNTIE